MGQFDRTFYLHALMRVRNNAYALSVERPRRSCWCKVWTPLGEGGLKLSGGERQRICIARALLRRPKLLILDEATSALDFQTEAAVIKNIGLLGKREEMITVVVSHRASAILNADQILVLDSGAIVEQGTPEELVKIRGFYYAIWNSNLAKIDVAK